MKIQRITTEREYGRALKEIEALMDAKPDSPEGDRLDMLAALVERYEEQHFPLGPKDDADDCERFRED